MDKKQVHSTSRIPLYSEIGKFFSPDGSFRELKFKNNLNELMKKFAKEYSNTKNSLAKIDSKISQYLTEIIEYLNEKKMNEAAFQLIKVALKETKKFGLGKISLPVEHLELFFNREKKDIDLPKKKKSSNDEKKQKIFKAALKVFKKETFRKSTMDKIAISAGIGKASVYRSFKNKEDLLDQLLNERFKEIISGFNLIYANGESDIYELLKKMINFWLKYISGNHTLYNLIQVESNPDGVSYRVIFSNYIVTHLPMLKERILSLNREKKLKTINFQTAIYGIFGFIDGAVLRWTHENMSYSLMDDAPEITEVLFYGIFL